MTSRLLEGLKCTLLKSTPIETLFSWVQQGILNKTPKRLQTMPPQPIWISCIGCIRSFHLPPWYWNLSAAYQQLGLVTGYPVTSKGQVLYYSLMKIGWLSTKSIFLLGRCFNQWLIFFFDIIWIHIFDIWLNSNIISLFLIYQQRCIIRNFPQESMEHQHDFSFNQPIFCHFH